MYYEPAELKVFEDIECEWPLFWTYLLLDGVFTGNKEQADEYAEGLRDILVPLNDSTKVIPELYFVPKDKVCTSMYFWKSNLVLINAQSFKIGCILVETMKHSLCVHGFWCTILLNLIWGN